MRKLILFLAIITGIVSQTRAQEIPRIVLSDSAKISLLTNAPWDEAVYSLFGHTSMRVNDPARGVDLAFNFGLFNMSKSNFIFLFMKGETDYMVAPIPYSAYYQEYKERGVGIIEQEFNLTQEEKQNIFNALLVNCLPENREYRYNYFYDNCSTRPRDIFEKYINGKIEYAPTNTEQTYRDLVIECTSTRQWFRFGINMVIGADADKVITDRQKDFLPRYLMNAYEGATVVGDSIPRNLVMSTTTLLDPKPFSKDFPVTPLYAGIILLIITLLISYISYKKQVPALGKVFDTILFLVAGIAGCIIFFLMFFSVHPCTNPNWNIVWLNPLQLIVALLFFVKSLTKYLSYYHFINFVALLAFLLAWCLIPQQLEIAFIPYILSIMIRSGMNVLQQKKLNKKAEYSLPKAK
ncbi:TM2 domain-containing membrane protein YozV [Dysgonomonas sp. PFB1-18]|uniref:lipoprotein N-acyltransferase Lnb domain-containing protein n=1 Tax=unclassified Dysgonomonas TaxID=2630389 RepID=UPI002472FA7C|nr:MULTISPECIES: DUF4105 domain-containing protein [unclassified Dysgonomonas]MDH6308800.1 TM2 domain-containing membrane protein YozV [Dysgonomonas sp. PF1-14]MDH6338503.1 TM2 domain-containing membrane protein YozV [Dysgonomonas sp. PF1-16]MDH6380049.1 TM2 domain-containing membrane protein YozV [Dysgonomonas sp. PFB1-18]MDH6397331.1 TM2 domain-containing membrane protein YozV [Dysgonomonas sp. PF1-23]